MRISSRGCGPPARHGQRIECRYSLRGLFSFTLLIHVTIYNVDTPLAGPRSLPVPPHSRLSSHGLCDVSLLALRPSACRRVPDSFHSIRLRAPAAFIARTSRRIGARRLLRHHGGDARGTRGPRARFRRRTRSRLRRPRTVQGTDEQTNTKKTKIGSVCGVDAW